MRNLLVLFTFFISFLANSQNSFKTKGKVIDKISTQPLESATVYFSRVSDSTVVDYAITEKDGTFELKLKKIDYPIFFKVSYNGFQEYKKQFQNITSDYDFGNIELEEIVASLDEIVLKSEAPPIVIKSDTLEFNASSFKVRPDANVQELLKQLPGLEIDSDGKITVNGKEVNQVLVNGKPFFDKDGKIALQNLPSEIINKVQITDTKTKKEEQTGAAASSNNASINLTIDEDKNKGFFGKIMGGYGSDDRYESSLLMNYFKNKRKISVLASSNNINSTGFSMDEIFDNMGGGRNRSVWVGDNGSFSINGRRFGGGNGITRTDMVGLNYSDEWTEDTEASGSYFFTNSVTENVNKRNQTNFLPDGDFSTVSGARTRNENTVHNFTTDFEYEIDSTMTVSIIPSFTKSKTLFKNNSEQSSFDENDALLNESFSDDFTENNSFAFQNNLSFTKNFKRKANYLSFEFGNKNNKVTDDDFTNSSTVFYQSTLPNDDRNQYNYSVSKQDSYDTEISYSQPITDSLQIVVATNYEFEKNKNARTSLNFDNTTNDFTELNDVLTNDYRSKQSTLTPKAGFVFRKKKYNVNALFGTSLLRFDNSVDYLGATTTLNKDYVVPYARIYGSYRFTKTKNIWVNYNYQNSLPSSQQVLAVEDLANPLNTFIGNPNLDINKYHTGYFSFRDYDYATRSGYSIYAGGNYYDNQVVSSVSFDANRKRTTTYENISGTYNGWFGISYNKSFKKEEHKFRLSLRLNSNYGLSKGITDAVLYTANSLQFTPTISFTYDYGELLTINPSYSFTSSKTDYTNYVIDRATNKTHRFNIQTTNYWPKNWVWGNDFGYNYNSNISNGFKKDFYLWNTSLSYNFFDKMFTAKVKVYDLLNQNQSNSRSITANTIVDEENIILKRYVMFSLTYKLEKFAGKKKQNSRIFIH